MKYLEDFRLTQLTSDLTEAFLNTRGSGSSGPSSSSSSSGGGRMGNGRGRGGNRGGGSKTKKQQQQQNTQQQSTASSRAKKAAANSNNNSSSPYLPTSMSYAYNPVGYSSYDNGTSSSSCRVIYGRVEAYTTKRAGSDKKTAHLVGENYAHEMEKLNEAVETMKRERRNSLSEANKEEEESGGNALAAAVEEERRTTKEEENKQQNESSKSTRGSNRPRSRSVDGVTFAGSSSLPLETLMEHSPLNVLDHDDVTTKRPLEGILKEPSNNKRSR